MSPSESDKKYIDFDRQLLEKFYEKFDSSKWEKAIEYKTKMEKFGSENYDPGAGIFGKIGIDENGLFIGDTEFHVTVKTVQNPDENGSFGFVGSFASVLSENTFIPGTLALLFDPDKLGNVARDTLRLFIWEEKSKVFQLIYCSGVSTEGAYVWGRITKPGLYAIIGLNSHPLIARTIKVLGTLCSFIINLTPDLQKKLQKQVYEMMFGSDELSKSVEESNFLRALIQCSRLEGLPDPFGLSSPRLESTDTTSAYSIPLGISERIFLPEMALVYRGDRPTSSVFQVDYGWENVGPTNFTGCIYQVVIDPNHHNTIYAAAADGGLWRLDDVRYSRPWIPLTDNNPNLMIDVVAVAPSNSDTIYIADRLGSIFHSRNHGETWNKILLDTEISTVDVYRTDRRFQKLIVDPSNDNHIFVASNTGFWEITYSNIPNPLRPSNLRIGDITDAAKDPDYNSIFYIGIRGVGVEKLERSSNGSWTTSSVIPVSNATPPAASNGMIKIALGNRINTSDRRIAVKFHREVQINQIANPSSWVSLGQWGQSPLQRDQANYDNVLAIDPFNNNIILTGLQYLIRLDISKDMANLPTQVRNIHEDQQSVVFDPYQPNVAYLSNDGGVYRSEDGGINWRLLNYGLITTQFYSLGVSGNRAISNVYHWGDLGNPNLSRSLNWENIEGGGLEFPNVFGDPVQPYTFYIFLTGRIVRRIYDPRHPPRFDLNHPSTFFANFIPTQGALTPFAISPIPPSNIMVAANQEPVGIMRTLNGRSEIYHPTERVYYSNATWTPEIVNNMGTEPIISICFAPSNPNMTYAISRVGEVYRKTNIDSEDSWERTGQWTGVTDVRQLEVNPLHENILYAVSTRKVAFSPDGGENWREIPGTSQNILPLAVSELFSIVAYPYDSQTLFVSTDSGVFVTTDHGANWRTFDYGLPNTKILQILWSGTYLYAVTHGRGLWRRQLAEIRDQELLQLKISLKGLVL